MPDYRRLLWEGRRWLATAVLLFFAGALLGFAMAAARPAFMLDQLRPVLALLRGLGQQVNESHSPVERTLVIFRNNAWSVLRIMALGVFAGLLPALGTLVNGALVGIVVGLGARISPLAASPRLLFLSLAPHGIFELPALWIGAAWGMKLGLSWLAPSATGRRGRVLAEAALQAGQMFVLAVLLLLVAAAIEGNVTAALVRGAQVSAGSPGILAVQHF